MLAEDVEDSLKFYPVSPRMNKPTYNAPDCIEPLADEAQAGSLL
jgi:hypothetical protein